MLPKLCLCSEISPAFYPNELPIGGPLTPTLPGQSAAKYLLSDPLGQHHQVEIIKNTLNPVCETL